MLTILAAPWANSGPADEACYAEAVPTFIPTDPKVSVIRISPRFPGCLDAPERDECARQRLEDYLYGSTTYPASPTN